ncbi:hypothetical protein CH063_01491, partial [Colletotrichum higginsianum]
PTSTDWCFLEGSNLGRCRIVNPSVELVTALISGFSLRVAYSPAKTKEDGHRHHQIASPEHGIRGK